MKKVLILAYDFPPYVSVGGIRPYNWYKFFPNAEVHPVVVTRQWTNEFGDYRDYIAPSKSSEVVIEAEENRTIIKTPYFPNMANRILLKHGEKKFRLLRRSISAFFEFGQFLLPMGPKFQLYKAAKEYLKKNKVDAIIATGDPFILFKYASMLSKAFKTPWIADYRDPWTHDTTKKKNIIINSWDSFFEKKIVSKASGIITVSKFIEDHIRTFLANPNCHIVPNGYDPEAVKSAQSVQQSDKTMSIAYAGTIAAWSPIGSFLRSCNNFVQSIPDVKFQINFYGIEKGNMIMEMLDKSYPLLKPMVKIHPRIPNMVLLKELSSNHLFLLFNCYSIIGTKIYDYIALNRVILLCYSDDEEAILLKKQFFHSKENHESSKQPQADMIEATNSGIVVKDEKHLQQVLKDKYQEFLEKGYIECKSVNSEMFSREAQTKKLAEIIELLK
jgi:hypothetical protein